MTVGVDGDIRSSVLDGIAWVVHGFGTRESMVPEGAPGFAMATVKQIHSADILDAGGRAGLRGEGDALISTTVGLAVGVKTADCVPILMADKNQHVVAAVHAGWRGTVAEIARLTVERMQRDYGTRPEDITAAIGPAIGECCFEVGPEVAREFAKWNGELAGTDKKVNLNLEEVNARQLVLAGVKPQRLDCAGLCTLCSGERFHSFRREREKAGRMMSWIGIRLRA